MPVQTVLKEFPNLVGHHCSSSAVRSILAYDGLAVSEALVFGLGSGLGFFYALEPDRSPSRRFNGRAPDLEGNFYRLAGADFRWAGTWQPELLHTSLAAGRPLIAQTDIFPIPYYDDAHFIGHGLAVVGLEDNEVLTADIAAQNFSRMPLERFREAIAHAHYPLLKPYGYAPAPEVTTLEPATLAPQAVAKTVAYMLTPPTPLEGVPGIKRMAADVTGWLELPDLPWVARFGYQAIEKRGTGGGNFRLLYRDFLAEVAPHLSGVTAELLEGFTTAAGHWTAVASSLKELAFAQEQDEKVRLLERVQGLLEKVAGLEQSLFMQLQA